jgi:hypothetical protein
VIRLRKLRSGFAFNWPGSDPGQIVGLVRGNNSAIPDGQLVSCIVGRTDRSEMDGDEEGTHRFETRSRNFNFVICDQTSRFQSVGNSPK